MRGGLPVISAVLVLGLLGLGAAGMVLRAGAETGSATPATFQVRVGWWFGLERLRVAAVGDATLNVGAASGETVKAGDSVVFSVASEGGQGLRAECGGKQVCGAVARLAPGPFALSAVVAESKEVVREDLPYTVEVRAQGEGLTVIVEVPLEEYVAGVLMGEASRKSPPAMLQALAIGARDFAVANRGKHERQGFDVCACSHCQNFRARIAEEAREAAKATAGLVLSKNGRLVGVHYHTTCGGTTDSSAVVWGGENPLWLLGIADDASGSSPSLSGDAQVGAFLANAQSYCSHGPMYRWTRTVGREELEQRLRAGLAALGLQAWSGPLTDVRVARRTPGGRAMELLLAGEKGAVTVKGENIRWVFDGGKVGGAESLPSRLFVVEKAGDGSSYTIRGGGWGHGVGICLAGAEYMAQQGSSAAEILAHYYPGCVVSDMSAIGAAEAGRAAH